MRPSGGAFQAGASLRASSRRCRQARHDDTQNIVLVLSRVDISPHQSWYRVRLPILPNNKDRVRPSGRYLSSLFVVHTHLYVDRGSLTATLKRDGKTIFKTIVGVRPGATGLHRRASSTSGTS